MPRRIYIIMWTAALTLAVACLHRDAGIEAAQTDQTCIADSLGDLTLDGTPLPECAATDLSCRHACLRGERRLCLARGFAIERDPQGVGEATLLFHRACELGSALGCTNYAATIWSRDHTVEELACAGRTFVYACLAEEPFACGMVGRVVLEASKSAEDSSVARDWLAATCESVEGFACRVYAKHIEAGDFGPYESEDVTDLLFRACVTGDWDACGEPETAAETFR